MKGNAIGGSGPILTETRWSILELIQRGKAVQAAALAAEMSVSSQAISKHLRAMFKDGLVAPDPKWGLARPVHWMLTERGTRFMSARSRWAHDR
jgi:predicted ArsR family transcriptional regulator